MNVGTLAIADGGGMPYATVPWVVVGGMTVGAGSPGGGIPADGVTAGCTADDPDG